MNWCEVPLFSNLPYLNSITKEAEKVSLKLNENYLNIPFVKIAADYHENQFFQKDH